MGDFRVMGGLKLYIVLICTICTMTVPVLCTGTGKCPVHPTPHNYDVHKMSGTWYEVERSFCPMELPTSCTSLNVTVNERGYMYITVHTLNRWTGSPSYSHGLGIPSYNGSSAFRYKLNNRMPYVIARLLPGAGQYAVLYTDYEQVAVVWSCTSVTLAHADRMWVLARRRELPASARAHVYSILQQLRLDPDRLYLAKNANCPSNQ